MDRPTGVVPVRQVDTSRVLVVDGLRGLASLAVCWYHLVYANHAFVGGGMAAEVLRNSARNAWTGVDVFFVISGFVIPLALFRAEYTPRMYFSFVLKRVVRLDPPYLVSAGLCLLLWYLWATVPHLHGPPFNPTLPGLLLHIGYLNAFFHQGWLNPVYWTLAIEFQYYLLMGVLFALIAHRSGLVRLTALAVLGVAAILVPNPSLITHYLFVFMLGIMTFHYSVGLVTTRVYLPLLAALTLGTYFTLGPMVAGVSLATALVIAYVKRDLPILGGLGTISYSLYLVHVPIGERVLGLGLSHVHGGVVRVSMLGVTLVLTIGAAAIFYWLVERPAQWWAATIRYRNPSRARRSGMESEGATFTGIAEP